MKVSVDFSTGVTTVELEAEEAADLFIKDEAVSRLLDAIEKAGEYSDRLQEDMKSAASAEEEDGRGKD